MTTISMYQCSAPYLTHTLKQLSLILGKAAAHAQARKIDPAVLVQARLYPDMLPLARQIMIACDTAKGAVGRLGCVDVPRHEDTETTLEELQARIAKTLNFIASVTPAQIDGSEDRDIHLKLGPREVDFKGQQYLGGFVLPNFYFHVTVAYAILRHNGVELGKLDFLGAV